MSLRSDDGFFFFLGGGCVEGLVFFSFFWLFEILPNFLVQPARAVGGRGCLAPEERFVTSPEEFRDLADLHPVFPYATFPRTGPFGSDLIFEFSFLWCAMIF